MRLCGTPVRCEFFLPDWCRVGALLCRCRVCCPRIRAEKWIQKLSEPCSNLLWKKSRNDYAALLSKMVAEREFTEPFNKLPGVGSLQSLPAYLVLSINQPKPSNRRQFWTKVYDRVSQQLPSQKGGSGPVDTAGGVGGDVKEDAGSLRRSLVAPSSEDESHAAAAPERATRPNQSLAPSSNSLVFPGDAFRKSKASSADAGASSPTPRSSFGLGYRATAMSRSRQGDASGAQVGRRDTASYRPASALGKSPQKVVLDEDDGSGEVAAASGATTSYDLESVSVPPSPHSTRTASWLGEDVSCALHSQTNHTWAHAAPLA